MAGAGREIRYPLVNGKQLIIPGTFHYVDNKPQGLAALMMAPIKGFVDASLIIGFVLIVGGAFAVLQKRKPSIR